MNFLPVSYAPGALIRNWTSAMVRAEIDAANTSISAALWDGDMDRAQTLVSRKIGLRICAGDIQIKLKAPK